MASPQDELLAIYDRTVDGVYRYAARLTGGDRHRTEELVQETYLGVLQRLRRGERLELSPGYLVVACRSRYLDQLRSGDRRRHRERAWTRTPGAMRTTAADVAGVIDGAPARDALRALPAEQRVALVMRYVDDLPVAEVAEQLGRSLHATESLLARARTALRTQLDTRGPR
jgi:RNA polymerase sigma-70 factor (ECF subfamily)